MPETLKTIGRLGLLERLDEETRTKALANPQDLIDALKNKTYERVQGIGDDFLPDTDLYNALGAIYPLFDRNQKDEIVKVHLRKLDGINYGRVNTNHTPYIREPLLLTDICIARGLYWPGLKDEERLWKGKEGFAQIEKDIMGEEGLFDPDKVNSDFLVAYALMRNNFTPFGEDYVKAANPEFLDRVMRGIVALRFAGDTTEEEIENGRKRLIELLPASVHERIEPLRKNGEWADAKKFR